MQTPLPSPSGSGQAPASEPAPAARPPGQGTATPGESHYRSKTFAAWLALLGGTLGLHRLYVHGLRDVAGWLHAPPTLLGLLGVQRLQQFGQDDRLAWALMPLLGTMISWSMANAILIALTPDERWHERHNPGHPQQDSGWGAVIAAVLGLLIGGIVLTGTIAYGGQKLFEWQLA